LGEPGKYRKMSQPSHSIFADAQPIASYDEAFAKLGFNFHEPGRRENAGQL
jgi:hypothetical protein